ncbi:hypothetical protein Tco_0620354 [Tanacetum coccineum]
MQPLDKAYTLIQKHSNPEWFLKKSGLAKRSTTWFDLFLKSDIDKDEILILGPSTVAIAKKFTIADFEGAGLERLKVQYNNDVELEYHVNQLKAAVLSKAQWNKEKYTIFIAKHHAARYYKEGIEDRIPERWSKEVRRYHFEALNGKSDYDMLIKNMLGSGNKRLKGRDWTDYDVKSSREMLKKIDEVLRHKEQLRRLEEYVGGRPKTINPQTFVIVDGDATAVASASVKAHSPKNCRIKAGKKE